MSEYAFIDTYLSFRKAKPRIQGSTQFYTRGLKLCCECSFRGERERTCEVEPSIRMMVRLHNRRLQKLSEMKMPCEHGPSNILGMMVEGQELLAAACRDCGDIKLMNLETEETHVAYSSEEEPDRLCHGEAGRMWVYCFGDRTVRELNCGSKTFTETGRTVNTTHFCDDMCYLPAPHRALILSHYQWMEAVFCETGQQLLRLEGEVDGNPWRVTVHPELQLLLMADWDNNRILVVDPETGSPLQTFPSTNPQFFWWSRGWLLLLHHKFGGKRRISHLRLVDMEKGESCSGLLLVPKFTIILLFNSRSVCCTELANYFVF